MPPADGYLLSHLTYEHELNPADEGGSEEGQRETDRPACFGDLAGQGKRLSFFRNHQRVLYPHFAMFPFNPTGASQRLVDWGANTAPGYAMDVAKESIEVKPREP